jgi:glycosyltransferase involved in cell wall biosynthesis
MKVVVVNFSETKGGAAKAARRLHLALLNNNIDSTFLTQFKETNDITVIGNTSKLCVIKAKLAVKSEELAVKKYKNKSVTPFSASFTGSKSIVRKINDLNPDVVHLHWVNAGMLSIEQIGQINAKIVWSLHDMWAFTGGCHYTEECEKYQSECGNCPVLKSNIEKDLSYEVQLKKKSLYAKKSMTIVGLSKWMAKSAGGSSLLKHQKVVNIPNPIDTKIFFPISKTKAKEKLNLPIDKKIILFGAMGATSDPRKGYKYLDESLELLETKNVELAIFGTNEEVVHPKFKTNVLGFISSDEKLNLIYNAADVMVVPSVQENLSNAIVESLAAGTPVVGFDIGGNSDMIDHKSNGYLSSPFNSDDLAKGISFVINQNSNHLSEVARKKIETTFEQNIVAKQYINLYTQILKND